MRVNSAVQRGKANHGSKCANIFMITVQTTTDVRSRGPQPPAEWGVRHHPSSPGQLLINCSHVRNEARLLSFEGQSPIFFVVSYLPLAMNSQVFSVTAPAAPPTRSALPPRTPVAEPTPVLSARMLLDMDISAANVSANVSGTGRPSSSANA